MSRLEPSDKLCELFGCAQLPDGGAWRSSDITSWSDMREAPEDRLLNDLSRSRESPREPRTLLARTDIVVNRGALRMTPSSSPGIAEWPRGPTRTPTRSTPAP